MNEALLASLRKMIVNGNRLELPKDEHFDNYPQVKKCLITAGAKYKRSGFDFPEGAQTVLDRLLGGEAINDKKKYQYFATPDGFAKTLIEQAEVTANCRVLEPSAGQGAIANIVRDMGAGCTVVELMPQNVKALERQGYEVHNHSFLELTENELGLFDKIVANPPFTNNQDIDHIRHMFSLLKPGGRLVSVASVSWTFGQQKKQVAFRAWLEDLGAVVTTVAAGTFKESGTQVETVVIELDKAA